MMFRTKYPDVFLYGYLTMASGCVYLIFNYIGDVGYTDRAGDTVLFRAFWIVLYFGLLLSIMRNASDFATLLGRSRLLLLFVSLAILSLTINSVGIVGVSKFALYLITILFGAWLAITRSVDEIAEAIFRVGLGALALHVVLYPFVSSVIDYDLLERTTILGTQSYAGVFAHKNLAGFFFSVLTIVSTVRLFSCERRMQVYVSLAAVVLHLLALAGTGAVGPLVALFATAIVSLGIYLMVSRQWLFAMLYGVSVALVCVLLVVDGADEVFRFVGRTSGLTGRTFLWASWPYFFTQKLWLGYGYGGFFKDSAGDPAGELWQMAPWHTHYMSFENSFLELGIDFGLLGGLTFLLIMLVSLMRSAAFIGSSSCRMRWAPFVVTTFVLSNGFNETGLLLHNHIACVLLFWGYFGPDVDVVETHVIDRVLETSHA
jgi:exopolysaccharide production protein ExoQ